MLDIVAMMVAISVSTMAGIMILGAIVIYIYDAITRKTFNPVNLCMPTRSIFGFAILISGIVLFLVFVVIYGWCCLLGMYFG
jgi:hypothetical protein